MQNCIQIKNAINHLYASATLLFDKNQLDEASSRFRTVISMNQNQSKQCISANLILGALDVSAQAKEEKGNFAEAAKDFAALREMPKLSKIKRVSVTHPSENEADL